MKKEAKFNKELFEILSQIYLLRMLKLLEGEGEVGQEVLKKYHAIVDKILQKDPSILLDNARLKKILDAVILKNKAFDTILKNPETAKILDGFSSPILRLKESAPTKVEISGKKEEKTTAKTQTKSTSIKSSTNKSEKKKEKKKDSKNESKDKKKEEEKKSVNAPIAKASSAGNEIPSATIPINLSQEIPINTDSNLDEIFTKANEGNLNGNEKPVKEEGFGEEKNASLNESEILMRS